MTLYYLIILVIRLYKLVLDTITLIDVVNTNIHPIVTNDNSNRHIIIILIVKLLNIIFISPLYPQYKQ